MKKLWTTLAGAALMSGLVASNVLAVPVDANTLNLTSLNEKFDSIKSDIDANKDELGTEVFEFTSNTTDALLVSITNTGTTDYPVEFGFYDIYNLNAKLKVFSSPPDTKGTNTTIKIKYNATDNTVRSFQEDEDGLLFSIDSEKFQANAFGSYITSGGVTYYSESDKNATGTDYFLAYAGISGDYVKLPGITPEVNDLGHFYVAGGGVGYDDVFVRLESVAPVPEPGTMLLLGAGFLGLAIYGKRRKNA